MILLAQLEHSMDKFFLPLGLLYVADALTKKGLPVEIFHEMGTDENIDLLVRKAKQEDISWVGFSTMTAPQLIPTIEASKRIKAESNATVVWGGIHPTVVDNVAQEPYVDSVVQGEGESWVWHNQNNSMDDFQPLWSMIDSKKYGDEIHIVSSRGCPFRCAFCYSPIVWKCKWKCHSVEKVIEIFYSYPKTPKKVEFRDDYFFAHRERGIKIVNALKTKWLATIRANDLTDDLVEKFEFMPDSLSMGVETASERLLKLIQKDIILHDVFDALDVANRHKIQLYCSLIVGLPTETEQERRDTLNLAKDLENEYSNVTCDVKKYRAYPKTPLFQIAIDNGFIPPQTTEEWAKYALQIWDSD